MLKYDQITVITGELRAGAGHLLSDKKFVHAFDPLRAKTINNW